MPIFRGRCRGDDHEIYFWADTGGHEIESAQLVFHSQQSDRAGERSLARAFAYITGRPILGLSDRRRNRRNQPYTRVYRAHEANEVPEIEVIDLTEGTSRSTQGDTEPSEGLRNEGGN